jgi:hypothetical protein
MRIIGNAKLPGTKGAMAKDNWQTTAWQLSQTQQQAIPAHDEHQ